MNHDVIQPTSSVDIGGVSYTVTFDTDAVEAAEELTDRSLLSAGFTKTEVEQPRVALVRNMFSAGVRKHHPVLSIADAKALVTPRNYARVWVAVIVAWAACMREPEPDAPGEAGDQS